MKRKKPRHAGVSRAPSVHDDDDGGGGGDDDDGANVGDDGDDGGDGQQLVSVGW